jgi:hypothetical protein
MSSTNINIQSNIFVKKCSYFLAIINKNSFINDYKAEKLSNSNIYIIKKDYDGSSTGETCAILGLDKWDTLSLLSDNNSNVLDVIKKTSSLSYIESLETLSLNLVQNTIKYFAYQIDNFLNDDELIIFNIEPKGQTRRHLKFYPTPNLSIPGGNMERSDELSIERCGEREFYEETGINIKDKYVILARNRQPLLKMYCNDLNSNRSDKKRQYSMSFPNYYSQYKKFPNEKIKKMVRIEKYFFLVKIK